MTLPLYIIGVLLMLLAVIHVAFPRYFHWKEELAHLSLINRQMMMVHSFFIALTVFLMGLLCVTSAGSLQNTVLGGRIALGLAVFWTIRLGIQLFGYSPALWKGKRFETIMHIVFTLFWATLSIVFSIIHHKAPGHLF